MRLISLYLATAAVVAALVAGATPRFAPSAGTSLKKHITTESKSKATKFEVLIDGESPGEGPEGFELSFDGDDDFTIVDEYVKSADGRPTEFKRTFEALSTKNVQSGGGGGAEPHETTKESELASKVVVFTWNEKKEEYEAKFEDAKGDEGLLEDLDPDLDFLSFLPEKEVKEGDEWEIDGSKARVLMYPGGDLKMESKESDAEGKEINKELRESIKGKLTLKHKGTKEEDGVKLVVLEIKGDIDGTGDAESEERGTTMIHVALKLSGEILWDATHNHVHSVAIDSEDHTLYQISADLDIEGESHKFEQKFTIEGTQKFRIEITK